MPASRPRLRFHPEWRISLFTLIMLPLLVGLGFWQLQRAEEKVALLASWDQRQSQPPVPLEQVWEEPADQLAYLPVTVAGRFDAETYFLLDNRMHAGRFGYEVIGILNLDSNGSPVLVNRGWVAGDPARLSLPAVAPVKGRVELKGHVYVAPGTPFLLAEQEPGESWPKVVEALEMDKLRPLLDGGAGDRLFSYPVRIDSGQPGALTVDWQVVNVSPDKHRAYAAQWFTMAAVLFAFYLLRSSNLWQILKSSSSERS
jgi:surfeit locus 1 family protein